MRKCGLCEFSHALDALARADPDASQYRSAMLRHSLSALGRRPVLPPFSTLNVLRRYHFDTHHFVRRLEEEGLSRAQAEGIMTAIAEVIDESIRNMTGNMVTKADQEKVPLYRTPNMLYITLTRLRSITILNKSTSHNSRASCS